MEIYKYFRIGPIRIYISTRRMARVSGSENRRQRYKQRLGKLKRTMYLELGGCCQDCGCKFKRKRLELHHIVPVSERPDLIASRDNLRLLCRDCHMKYHRKPEKPR